MVRMMLMVYSQCSSMMREDMGVRVLATEMVNFRSALGRVLCQEVRGKINLEQIKALGRVLCQEVRGKSGKLHQK